MDVDRGQSEPLKPGSKRNPEIRVQSKTACPPLPELPAGTRAASRCRGGSRASSRRQSPHVCGPHFSGQEQVMSSHFFGPHRLQSQHRATPGSGPSLLQAPTLPTQHSQPLPAPPTAEMPPPGVGAEPAHPRAMETEPRARDHRTGRRATRISQPPATRTWTGLLASTGFTLDAAFSFIYLFCYEETQPAASLTLGKQAGRRCSSSA